MIEKITIWFDKLSSLSKAVISVIAVFTAVSGYMTLHDKKVIERYESVNEQAETRIILNRIVRGQERDSIYRMEAQRRDDSMRVGLSLIRAEVSGLKTSNTNLKLWLIENASTKDDVLNILNIFIDEKKK
jgi:hypothetical protein